MKKKYFAILMVFVMLFSNTAFAHEVNIGANLVKHKIQQMDLGEQIFVQSEDYIQATREYDNLMKNMSIKDEYASYYGGAYLTDDEDLIVLLTNKSKEVVSKIKEATGSADVTIQYVDVPLNYLKELQINYGNCYERLYELKDIAENFSEVERCLLEDLRATYIDQSSNELVVQISNITSEKIYAFQELFGEEQCVRYQEGGTNVSTASEWRPGRYIYTTAQQPFSTGYRAYYIDSTGTRYNGFVTAGHACSATSVIYRSVTLSSSNILGICKVSKNSGTVDAAFVAISDADYTPSNVLSYPSDVTRVLETTSYATSVLENEWVYKAGGTSLSTVGRVVSSNAQYLQYGAWLSDLYMTNALNLVGDSGGCAYVIRNNKCLTIGSMKGSQYTGDSLNANTFEYSYITKIGNTISALGIRKY